MLNETLNKVQSEPVAIRGLTRPVIDTGIGTEVSANADAKELARQRFQRMRRRHGRSIFSARTTVGWVARMA